MRRAVKTMVGIFLVLCIAPASAHDVVVQRNTNLRAGPSTTTEVIKLLEAGDEARLLETESENGYYRVLRKEGIGWVWGHNVKVYPEYLRGDWKHWIDEDGDCQDTRVEVLISESEIAVELDEDGCKVVAGRWTGPYTGEVFTDPSKLDIDHMVPLKNAHRAGGWSWDKAKRKAYANDIQNPAHLIAVKASANRSKGWKGPDLWKPPLQSYWCQYATDWESIKSQWHLDISTEEQGAISEMKATCN